MIRIQSTGSLRELFMIGLECCNMYKINNKYTLLHFETKLTKVAYPQAFEHNRKSICLLHTSSCRLLTASEVT